MTKEIRSNYDNPTMGEYVEYLYNEVKRIYDEEHPGVSKPGWLGIPS